MALHYRVSAAGLLERGPRGSAVAVLSRSPLQPSGTDSAGSALKNLSPATARIAQCNYPNYDLSALELHFEDLETAKQFYSITVQIQISEEQIGRQAKFAVGSSFVCLKRKERNPIHRRTRQSCFSRWQILQPSWIQLARTKLFIAGGQARPVAWALITMFSK
jgi:hypothetical protein